MPICPCLFAHINLPIAFTNIVFPCPFTQLNLPLSINPFHCTLVNLPMPICPTQSSRFAQDSSLYNFQHRTAKIEIVIIWFTQSKCKFFELQSHQIGKEGNIFEDYLRDKIFYCCTEMEKGPRRKYKCYFGLSLLEVISIVKCTVGSPPCWEFQSSKERKGSSGTSKERRRLSSLLLFKSAVVS